MRRVLYLQILVLCFATIVTAQDATKQDKEDSARESNTADRVEFYFDNGNRLSRNITKQAGIRTPIYDELLKDDVAERLRLNENQTSQLKDVKEDLETLARENYQKLATKEMSKEEYSKFAEGFPAEITEKVHEVLTSGQRTAVERLKQRRNLIASGLKQSLGNQGIEIDESGFAQSVDQAQVALKELTTQTLRELVEEVNSALDETQSKELAQVLGTDLANLMTWSPEFLLYQLNASVSKDEKSFESVIDEYLEYDGIFELSSLGTLNFVPQPGRPIMFKVGKMMRSKIYGDPEAPEFLSEQVSGLMRGGSEAVRNAQQEMQSIAQKNNAQFQGGKITQKEYAAKSKELGQIWQQKQFELLMDTMLPEQVAAVERTLYRRLVTTRGILDCLTDGELGTALKVSAEQKEKLKAIKTSTKDKITNGLKQIDDEFFSSLAESVGPEKFDDFQSSFAMKGDGVALPTLLLWPSSNGVLTKEDFLGANK